MSISIEIGDLVKYTAGGDKLDIGIVLKVFGSEVGEGGFDGAEVLWSADVKWPIRTISRKWLEVINENR